MIKEIIKKFIPIFLLDFYHFSLAGLGAFLYRFPSKKIKVIGVTGTNGKTTVVHFVSKILEQADYKVASISSIKFKIADKEWKNTLKMTMPGRLKLQKFLRQAVNTKCQYVVLEVTSEGIKQYRHRFIDFDTAVFTNLTPEHIESHGSFEKYKEAKGKLFQNTKGTHIINLDDENTEYFLKFPANKKYTFGFNKGDVNLNNTSIKLGLTGEFNKYNALAAISVGLSQGIDLEICQQAIEKIKGIPGRMEIVIKEPFRVIVDYAFTPAALQKVYQTLKAENKKMICGLGACGGGRDKWKRPVLGELSGRYCQEIVLDTLQPHKILFHIHQKEPMMQKGLFPI